MEKSIKLTPLHCIFYIYHTFAFSSDGKLDHSERNMIMNFMYRWVGEDKEKMNKIINETMSWSRVNIKNDRDQIGSMMSMVEFLKNQKKFNIAKREYFLMDIRNIARANGDFISQQKKWHDMLAVTLDVEIRISNSSIADLSGAVKKVVRKKIGFRR